MRYLVLTWHSPILKDYRRGGWFDDPDAAWACAAHLFKNTGVRLALVVASPKKPKPDVLELVEAAVGDASPYRIPGWLMGNDQTR